VTEDRERITFACLLFCLLLKKEMLWVQSSTQFLQSTAVVTPT